MVLKELRKIMGMLLPKCPGRVPFVCVFEARAGPLLEKEIGLLLLCTGSATLLCIFEARGVPAQEGKIQLLPSCQGRASLCFILRRGPCL